MNYVLIDLNSDSRCKSHINFFYFFFSSRRRHTRWNCDWSSDVWSSDLDIGALVIADIQGPQRERAPRLGFCCCPLGQIPRSAGTKERGVARIAGVNIPTNKRVTISRSEERRVGKECRSRWGRDQCNEKE